MATKFEGFTIGREEGGFYWQEGGYFDTIEECQADIADWNRDLRSDENIYGLASVQQSIMEDTHR